MNVSDLMTRNPVTIRSSSTLRQALEAMEGATCHHLPVLNSDNQLVGIITARDCRLALSLPDIVRDYWQEDELATKLLVRAVMTPAATTTTPDMTAQEAARLMIKYYLSCLPVLRGETLVGVITVSDFLTAFARERSEEG